MAQNSSKRKCSRDESGSAAWMGETDIELDAFSFTWAISKYSFLSDLTLLESPVFYGGPKSNHGWKLLLRPKNKAGYGEHVSISLELSKYGNQQSEFNDIPVKAHFQISILNRNGEPDFLNCFEKKRIYEFTKSSDSTGHLILIGSEDVFEPSNRLIVDDTLKILCQLWIHGEMKAKVATCKCEPSDVQKTKLFRDRFATDFGKMFSQSIATDCTVWTGETSFKAHKFMLSARSSVFAAMFNANMMERETATVKIADFDKEVVKGMLEHLYTGETTVMAARAQELLQIAEKYNLEGLKEDCEYAITDKLNKDNVAEVLVLAHTHNADFLKSHAISFINWNKAELMKMTSFQDAAKASAHTGLFDDLGFDAKK